eukprot:CCRYP_002143-RA/>CCRYP_002143-RA protein AED:0.27 eAED:0.27 QI:0/-1/0/1/-1/1/1/0/146
MKIKDKQKQQQQITETINGSNTTVASQNESPLPFFATRSATTLATQNSQKSNQNLLRYNRQWRNHVPPLQIGAVGIETIVSNVPEGASIRFRWECCGVGNQWEEGGSSALAEKDLAMSIFALRKMLQNEDFKRVFDQRNQFIAEIE